MGLELSALRACVSASTLLNITISETSGPIIIKFYLKHNCGGGMGALGFGPVPIRF